MRSAAPARIAYNRILWGVRFALEADITGVLNSAPNGTFGTPGTSGLLQCIPLPPRMTGVTLGYKF